MGTSPSPLPFFLAFVLSPDKDQDPEAAARLRIKVFEAISRRELEYVLHVCDPEEYTHQQIAVIMSVGEDRVDEYRKALSKKFGIKSKSGVVIFAHAWDIPGMARDRARQPPKYQQGASDGQAAPGP